MKDAEAITAVVTLGYGAKQLQSVVCPPHQHVSVQEYQNSHYTGQDSIMYLLDEEVISSFRSILII